MFVCLHVTEKKRKKINPKQTWANIRSISKKKKYQLTSKGFPFGPLGTLYRRTSREAQGTMRTNASLRQDSVNGSTPFGPWLNNLNW